MRSVLIVAVLLAGCHKHQPPANRPVVDAGNLTAVWRDYADNAAAADAKYRDKRVQGRFDTFDPVAHGSEGYYSDGRGGIQQLSLEGNLIRCYWRDGTTAAKVSAHGGYVVSGDVVGFRDGQLALADCTIDGTPPKPTPQPVPVPVPPPQPTKPQLRPDGRSYGPGGAPGQP